MAGARLVGDFRKLASYRSRLYQSVLQEIRQRYAGSVLGIAWAVLYPLMLLGLYAVIYVFIFRVTPPSLTRYEYVILVFSGLVPLLAFNESLMAAVSSLVSNRNLLLNTFFPSELIPVRAILAAQTPSIVSISTTLVCGFLLGRPNWNALLAVPILWLLLIMFVTGLGWVLALLTLVARDIQHVMGLILMALIILSPFAYTPEMVPSSLRALLYLNPLSYYVLGFQQVITFGKWPSLALLAPMMVLSFGSFFGGFWFFQRVKHVFFDYA